MCSSMAMTLDRNLTALMISSYESIGSFIETAGSPESGVSCQDTSLADSGARFCELARQREGMLAESGRVRLEELLAAYRHDMVRKAQALREAVARGL